MVNLRPLAPHSYAKLYPQNGERIVTIDAVTEFHPICLAATSAFSALTLLVGRQEGHPACKKT